MTSATIEHTDRTTEVPQTLPTARRGSEEAIGQRLPDLPRDTRRRLARGRRGLRRAAERERPFAAGLAVALIVLAVAVVFLVSRRRSSGPTARLERQLDQATATLRDLRR